MLLAGGGVRRPPYINRGYGMQYEVDGQINRPDIDKVIISLLTDGEEQDKIDGNESG